MAVVVLFSTLSFAVSYHYCGDTLVDAALFENAENCGMDMDAPYSVTKNPCCNDVTIAFEGQDELKLTFDKLNLDQQVFLATFFNGPVDLFEGQHKNMVPGSNYPPPFLVKDISLMYQVFII